MRANHYLIAAAALLCMLGSCGSSGRKTASADKETIENNAAEVKTIHLTRADFIAKVGNIEEGAGQWKYLGDKPCIVDFYADWCGPCKMIAPILEELAAEYDGEIYIYKVDTEAERKLASEFNIRSIPSLLFCPVGEDPQMLVGAQPKGAFKQAIDEILLKKS
jgi:thioredoxin